MRSWQTERVHLGEGEEGTHQRFRSSLLYSEWQSREWLIVGFSTEYCQAPLIPQTQRAKTASQDSAVIVTVDAFVRCCFLN